MLRKVAKCRLTVPLAGAGNVTGGNGFNPGQAFGNGIFLQGNNTLTFTLAGTETVAGVIGDDTGSASAAHFWGEFNAR